MPYNGTFGPVRNNGGKNHQGLDIFADIQTTVYACMDGTVVSYGEEKGTGFGNVMVLKVKTKNLLPLKRDYKREFSREAISGPGFSENQEFLYFRYCHLSENILKGPYPKEVKCGDEIAKSGDTGNAKGVPGPHVHFELCTQMRHHRGIGFLYNPAYYVRLVTIDKTLQTSVRNKRKKHK